MPQVIAPLGFDKPFWRVKIKGKSAIPTPNIICIMGIDKKSKNLFSTFEMRIAANNVPAIYDVFAA
jgi:hypothetical protein